MDNLSEFINNNIFELISSVLGILGFILSVLTITINAYKNRCKVNVTYKGIRTINENFPYIAFELIMENKSMLPVSVTRMFLKIDDSKYEFEYLPHQYYIDTYRNNKTESVINVSSIPLPVNIDSLGAIGGCFYILNSDIIRNHVLNTPKIKMIIHTNRRVIKSSFTNKYRNN